jgi:hypothetical protein
MDYPEFAARVRRRSEGRNEDRDWEEPKNIIPNSEKQGISHNIRYRISL